MKQFIIAIVAVSAIGGMHASTVSDVSTLISQGKFRLAEQKIESSKSEISAQKADSLLAVIDRIRSDFRIPYEEGVRIIQQSHPGASLENIADWERLNYIETKNIDGLKYMFRKSPANLARLVPELSAEKQAQIIEEDRVRANQVQALVEEVGQKFGLGKGRRMTVRYTIDVDKNAVPAGKKIRVWMPYPIESQRQKNVTLVSSSDKVVYSDSPTHNTIYMERPAKEGENAHFEAVFSYDVYPAYYPQDYLMQQLKPYDKSSGLYRKYTSSETPQILLTDKMKALASKIVGDEKNPVVQASLIFNWIDAYFPWAGAREYSTIPNLAEYALERGYGDCGQVSLLYITLLRSIGIPARWESGWALAPDDPGIHDWAEIYFEGIGWVPCDMSYGILKTNKNPNVMNFYKAGLDYFRFAANRGVNGIFVPKKEFIRSETVDSQLGEVEWEGGNIFYYKGWTPSLEVLSVEELIDK